MTAKNPSYKVCVWYSAMREAEQRLMSVCPNLNGGKASNETVEDYCARGRAQQDEALANLKYARNELEKAHAEDKDKKTTNERTGKG